MKKNKLFIKKAFVLMIIFLLPFFFSGTSDSLAQDNPEEEKVYSKLVGYTQGDDGVHEVEIPLKHTNVKADVSGYISKVEVIQKYENNLESPVEAVYTFPLPENAAIYSMEMIIGDKVIKGEIKEKEEAQEIYQKARNAGQRASLLDQERPNIFKQSIANIMPGDSIEIKISYVETLKYDAGKYSFVFPMLVGPRYMSPSESIDSIFEDEGVIEKEANESEEIYDDFIIENKIINIRAERNISPPVLMPNERSGHDISLSLKINTGNIEIKNIESNTHDIDKFQRSLYESDISIKNHDSIPNKDFVLTYDVSGALPKFAVLTEKANNDNGFFTMMIQPPLMVSDENTLPKEMFFIVDISGSMRGTSMKVVKEAMVYSLKNLNPQDTFNVYPFANKLSSFSREPLLATENNINKGIKYVNSLDANGGTVMMPAINKAISEKLPEGRLRIVSLMSDGLVRNDDEILGKIQNETVDQVRFFPFTIGSSPNTYLLDRMAELGKGKSFYVRNNDDPIKVIDEFYARIDAPIFINLKIDWDGLDVYDIYPKQLPDLFVGEPVYVSGRYKNSGNFNVVLSGIRASIEGNGGSMIDKFSELISDKEDFSKKENISVSAYFPRESTSDLGISSIWARSKVKDLMSEYRVASSKDEVEKEIIEVGIAYHLMTNFTSFVAVEETIVNEDGEQRKVMVPVEIPDGTTYEGFFGATNNTNQKGISNSLGSGSLTAADLWGSFSGESYVQNETGLGNRGPRTIYAAVLRLVLFAFFVISVIVSLIATIIFYRDRKKEHKSRWSKRLYVASIVLLSLGFIIYVLSMFYISTL